MDHFKGNVSGFTLVEMIVVLSILVFIITASIVGGINLSQRARATHIANDFKAVKTAWLQYATDVGGICVNESDFNNPTTKFGCSITEPYLTETHLYTSKPPNNPLLPPTWKGPYIDSAMATDPWGRGYTYDSDQESSPYDPVTGNNKYSGVNIQIQWCTHADRAFYMQIADDLDEIIDDSDGSDRGLLRWENGQIGRIAYLLAPDADGPCPN